MKTGICVFFNFLCLDLVAMATPFAPLKFLFSIFKFPDPENPTILANIVSIFCTKLKAVQFCFFWPNFGCHGNSLGSLENLVPYLNSATPKILLFVREIPRFLTQN